VHEPGLAGALRFVEHGVGFVGRIHQFDEPRRGFDLPGGRHGTEIPGPEPFEVLEAVGGNRRQVFAAQRPDPVLDVGLGERLAGPVLEDVLDLGLGQPGYGGDLGSGSSLVCEPDHGRGDRVS
jgi:hypothetical protein